MFRLQSPLLSHRSKQPLTVRIPTMDFWRGLHNTIRFTHEIQYYTDNYPLFRGDPSIRNNVSVANSIFGMLARNIPTIVTAEHVVSNKDDVLSARFLSLTKSKQVAQGFSSGAAFYSDSAQDDGVVIKIDPTLMQGFLIDAERTFALKTGYPHSAREEEVNALVVLPPSIISFTVAGSKILNPFYTKISSKDDKLIAVFHEILRDYVILMRNLNGQGEKITLEQRDLALNSYAIKFAQFYQTIFQDQSPLHLKIGDFLEKFPKFGELLKDAAKKTGLAIFSDNNVERSFTRFMQDEGAQTLFRHHHSKPERMAKIREQEQERVKFKLT